MKSTDYIEKIEMNAKSKGIYSIDLCPISNTIRFTAKYAGCMYAYVVGDFNGWEKSDDYKLTWQIDTNDKELKMIKEVKFQILAGDHQFFITLTIPLCLEFYL